MLLFTDITTKGFPLLRFKFVAILLSALSLAACGGDKPSASADFNQADVEFLQGMIPHHQQAITMSQYAATQAEAPDVKAIAERINGEQAPEITQMQGLLQRFGAKPADEGHGGDHGNQSQHRGTLSDAAMADLKSATGRTFDSQFVSGMIEHHRGAISVAEMAIAEGKNAEVKALAKRIATAQGDEIKELNELDELR